MMNVSETGAARADVYVWLSREKVTSSVVFPVEEGGIAVDLDANGRPVGVDISDAEDVMINGAGMVWWDINGAPYGWTGGMTELDEDAVKHVAEAVHAVVCDCGVPSAADYAYVRVALTAREEWHGDT